MVFYSLLPIYCCSHYYIGSVYCPFFIDFAHNYFLTDLIKEVLSMDDEIQKLATELYHQKSVLIMGRGYHYATCLEGALVSLFTSVSLLT